MQPERIVTPFLLKHPLIQLASRLIAPILLIAIASFVMPIRSTFEFDTDEGINLMKAFLYSEGYSLYTDIWSDQPPVLTVLLAQWIDWFGPSVYAARILVLSFSALLIWSFHQILEQSFGKVAALVGALFLILSRFYIKMSISVMIGLPSLAMAMLSLYLLTRYKRKPHWGWLIASGGLFALSLQTKLFTIFLTPILLLFLLDFRLPWSGRSPASTHKTPLWHIGLWIGCLLVVFLGLGAATHSINYAQLLQPHLAERTQTGFDYKYDFVYLLGLIVQDYDLALVALLSVIAACWKPQARLVLPLVWLATAFLLLAVHRPIWYHHYPLVAIPMAWMSAYGVTVVGEYVRQSDWRADLNARSTKAVLPCLLAIALLIAVVELPSKINAEWNRPIAQWRIVSLVKKYSEHTKWVFTDRPIIPFYAGLPVPPELAVFSNKRLVSGNLTGDQLLDIFEKYHPEQVVLARVTDEIKADPRIEQYLNEHYTRTFKRPAPANRSYSDAEHYIINTYPG